MPEVVKSIQESSLDGIYGRTVDNRIQIEQSLNYEDKKLYFFHELTHALQSSHKNGRKLCGFYNGHDGMFLTEGATQYTAEMLYNISNDTNLQYREQQGRVRGARNRTTYSPLSEYQYNGNILDLLAKSMDLPLPQLLGLAYKPNGREALKGIYESMEGNQGKFNELMSDLEKIYSIDSLLIYGYEEQLQSQTPLNIIMQDGITEFLGNINIYRNLMDTAERKLVAIYMENHDKEYVLQNYSEIAQYLTTPELKEDFSLDIEHLSQEMPRQNNIISFDEYKQKRKMKKAQFKMPEGYSINEFGEIIRPTREKRQEQIKETSTQQNESKLTLKQKVAQFLQENNLFMNVSFVSKFVIRQLVTLPPATQKTESTSTKAEDRTRGNSIKELTNFEAYRNLPSIQRMSDPERLARMKRKMEQKHPSKDDNERD